MKIALVSAYFYPYSNGGTEKYVLNLAKKLIIEGNIVKVITAFKSVQDEFYFQDLEVIVLPDETSTDRGIITGCTNPSNLIFFKSILEKENFDLIHFHTLTPAFNIFHLEEVHKNGIKIHFTAHVPAITCIHGDLMQFGETACHGKIDNNLCKACYLNKKGVPRQLCKLVSKSVDIVGWPKSIFNVVTQKQRDLQKLNKLCDKLYLFTNWQEKIFLSNGFDSAKIKITTQLIGEVLVPQKKVNRKTKTIAFIGRISREKGLHILVNSFILSHRKDLNLLIIGIENDAEYLTTIQKMSLSHQNILWKFNLSNEEVSKYYKDIDVLIIPSIWYETGPYVLYEAIENGVSVIANNLGDMSIWRDKGFQVEVYNSSSELVNLLEKI
jgi:glycosyltransferase involved in cell wall biosynthesis